MSLLIFAYSLSRNTITTTPTQGLFFIPHIQARKTSRGSSE
ncbi:hypothetical protein HMPREF0322_04202 [Desulfitobacterium hafniense DP7]|uniref:Uncharacterized protein n=1 Tax=Desulfitobacterium hafniense DP7 TaxID=537010 RepID=G9XT96_DESHA|nr:hypothetical protein HMPREF0322_04202 [Desulfitobacterium hafniense DP7]